MTSTLPPSSRNAKVAFAAPVLVSGAVMLLASVVVFASDPDPVDRPQVDAESVVFEALPSAESESEEREERVAVQEPSRERRLGFSPVRGAEEEDTPGEVEDGKTTQGAEGEPGREGESAAPSGPFVAGFVEPPQPAGPTQEEKDKLRERLRGTTEKNPLLRGIPGLGAVVREKQAAKELGAEGTESPSDVQDPPGNSAPDETAGEPPLPVSGGAGAPGNARP